ncbi:ankyrin repeat-containing domain protein [Chytridium lagenaria]|nr:ankyrin repeat-containing domain protein [Chytridium lagenaria]
MTIGKITAHSVEVSWSNLAPLKPPTRAITLHSNNSASLPPLPSSRSHNSQPPKPVIYYLSRAEGDDPEYEKVYEGTYMKTVVDNLKPQTTYRFKLRVYLPDKDAFSKDFSEAVATTSDESHLGKITLHLFHAVQDDDSTRAEQILKEYGKDVNVESRDKYGKTLLMMACQSGSRSLVWTLLRYGALTTSTTRSNKTPLSIAVSNANLNAIESILEYDTHCIDIPDQGGSTPLMWAVENGSHKNGPAIVSALLRAGADPLKEDMNGYTALERLCITCGNLKCARLLFDHGARVVGKVERKRPMTTLMLAALNGHKDICRELVEKWHVDIRAQTDHGQTARSMAEGNGHMAVVEYLDKRLKRDDERKQALLTDSKQETD